MNIYITKSDGSKELFNADKINKSIERATEGLSDPISKVTQIATETSITIYDGINTEELDQATINAAVQNIQFDIEYDKVATRLLLKTIYRKVVGDYNKDSDEDFKEKHKIAFEDTSHQQRFLSLFSDKEIIDSEVSTSNEYFTGRYDIKIKYKGETYICDFKSNHRNIYFENNVISFT